MILIICESILATKTVAIALGANNETSEGIHTSGTLTVATVPPRFIRHTPLGEMADGKVRSSRRNSGCPSPTRNWNAS